MLIIRQSDVDARLSRNDDLLAEAAHDRLIAAMAQSSSSATPRPIGRIRILLRHDAVLASAATVASLVVLALIG